MSQTAAVTADTKIAARVARAAEHIGATKLNDGRWVHYAEETGRYYVVDADELAELCDYLDSDDEQIAGDAYSHWCAGTVAQELAGDAQIETLRSEAAEAGDGVQMHLCDRALDGDLDARVACSRAIADAAAMVERTDDAWWAWHDADSSRWSQDTAMAERRCAAWVAGKSDDGPAR